jgi:tetratricopeptide (TPR) repeat protein
VFAGDEKNAALDAIEAMIDDGKLDEARQGLNRIKREFKNNQRYYVIYGRMQLWKKEYGDASGSFKAALKIDPNCTDAHIGLAYAYSWLDHDDLAIKEVDRVLERYPDNVSALILKAWMLSWNDDAYGAIAIFEEVLKKDPENIQAIRGMAKSYTWKEQYSIAEKYYEQWINIDHDNPEPYLELAALYERMGNYSAELRMLEVAKALGPERTDIDAKIGLVKKWTLDLDDEIRRWNRRAALDFGDIGLYIVLGKTYQWQGKFKNAERLLKEALSKDPDNVFALYSMGDIQASQGDWVSARKSFERILDIDPNNLEAKYYLDELKYIYHPRATFRYGLSRQSGYFDLATNNITREDIGIVEYEQPVYPWWIASAGYSYSLNSDVNKTRGLRDYLVDRHSAYFESDFKLPLDIDITARYTFYVYKNRGQHVYSIDGTAREHGANVFIQKEIWHNALGFQFNRDFFVNIDGDDLNIESSNMYTAMDDIAFNDYLDTLLAVNFIQGSSQDGDVGREYIFRPRLRMPFYDRLIFAYEFKYSDDTDGNWNTGDILLQQQLADWLQFEVGYEISYYSVDQALSHTGVFSFIFSPLQRLHILADGRISYADGDNTQDFAISAEIVF